jgi:hypothetical protein
MSEASVAARKHMKEKAHRLASGDPHAKVDASSWSPPEPLDADVMTGERPVSPRQYKRGGKVEGAHAKMRADRKPRKSGGAALSADSYLNRDVKEANDERAGTKHIGGFKRGGSPHGDEAEDRKLVKGMVKREALKKHGGEVHAENCGCKKCAGGSVSDGSLEGTRPTGGRMARADGGPVGYHIKDGHTGDIVGKAKTSAGATRSVVRRDNVYGAYRYHRVPIYADHPSASDFAPKSVTPDSDPIARKSGGRAGKGKMNVNIIIAQKPDNAGAQQAMPMPAPRPVGVPMPAPQGPAMGGPGLTGSPPAAGGPPPMMPRKSGGRTIETVAHDMEEYGGGGGGGLGRLEKIRAYGDQR